MIENPEAFEELEGELESLSEMSTLLQIWTLALKAKVNLQGNDVVQFHYCIADAIGVDRVDFLRALYQGTKRIQPLPILPVSMRSFSLN